ncbi:hypothetical protein ACFPPF_21960 [Xenophilus aerolatus]|nr:hypothetical protein [Xenophilus aerolatus]
MTTSPFWSNSTGEAHADGSFQFDLQGVELHRRDAYQRQDLRQQITDRLFVVGIETCVR